MRYFLDTEFNEDGKTIDLISIALVVEDGRELYLCNRDAELHRANPWVRENVLPHLPPLGDPRWASREDIKRAIVRFVGATAPEFWAYFADYDWVVFCQLFGAMVALPNSYPKHCLDLKQVAHHLELPKEFFPPKPKDEHNALADARWNLELYKVLAAKWAGEGWGIL